MVFSGCEGLGGHMGGAQTNHHSILKYIAILSQVVYTLKKRSHTNEKFKSEVIDMTDD